MTKDYLGQPFSQKSSYEIPREKWRTSKSTLHTQLHQALEWVDGIYEVGQERWLTHVDKCACNIDSK